MLNASRLNALSPRRALVGLAALATGLAALPLTPVLGADDKSANFELPGPDILAEVTRNGETLPVSQVPNLKPGDAITLHLPRGKDASQQADDFLLVSAFLRGAVNPPPDAWIAGARGWKDKAKDNTLTLKVPEGAHQLVLLMVPRTGGADGVLEKAVQGKPGEFVRAGGELYEASLDHSRLEAFMGAIRAQGDRDPEALQKVAPVLASSLGIKLQKDCLDKVLDEQASCLVKGRSSLVLSDLHTSSLADTLAGTPTDLALQLSATPQAGSGSYSAYIGAARDIAKLFGAFNNPQFGYLPALTVAKDDRLSLLLNTAPSFAKPKSVMVVGMPTIEDDVPPQLHATSTAPLCAVQGPVILPVDGAPLVFSTDFAHAMQVRVTAADGRSVELPIVARADHGGYVFDARALPKAFTGALRAHVHGRWGFSAYDGPDFTLQRPDGTPWQAAGDGGPLILGRDSTATLAGVAPACVSAVMMEVPGAKGPAQKLDWKVDAIDRLAVSVPLKDARPGPVQLAVQLQGQKDPVSVTLDTRAEASRLDALDLHAQDSVGTLTGQRLDQVKRITLGKTILTPDGLSREGDHDVLALAIEGEPLPAEGTAQVAKVELAEGRTARLSVTIAPPRPSARLLSRSVAMPARADGARPLALQSDDLLPEGGELVFSLEAPAGKSFGRDAAVEIAQGDSTLARLTLGKGLIPSSAQVLVARFDSASLPQGTYGALRYRVLDNGVPGAWQPLATLVRLPQIRALSCAKGTAACTLTGRNLFFVSAVSASADFARPVEVPVGFTGSSLTVTPSAEGTLYLRLRDDPDAVARLSR
ncbi:hypothetical protein MTR62_09425 [Novosphingobium sp. 1949]|uniref:Uncharacterized protein n=1 Tax=Novosphingobium organovorum TaxID=2930092 RepID=A0ABT0BDN3_9SPHN|nr:hypothetical protein [Novosphingobium organovorum]MCJ2182909.1 hypothetical protein [Novosphingobium organovorum]